MTVNTNTVEKAIKYFIDRTLDDHGYPINKEHCETALKALYKQNAIKPISHEKFYFKCPHCKEELGIDVDDITIYDMKPPKYCVNCGQALDWGDRE